MEEAMGSYEVREQCRAPVGPDGAKWLHVVVVVLEEAMKAVIFRKDGERPDL